MIQSKMQQRLLSALARPSSGLGARRRTQLPPASRLFASNHPRPLYPRASTIRPAQPFLSSHNGRIRFQFIRREVATLLSAETRKYVKEQTLLGAVWGTSAAVILSLVGFLMMTWRLEKTEEIHPSPPEWSYYTRRYFREAYTAFYAFRQSLDGMNWYQMGPAWLKPLLRLEDQSLEGQDTVEVAVPGVSAYQEVQGVRPLALDVSKKSEEWKAGYVDVVMRAGENAEHVQDILVDEAQNRYFHKSMVLSKSNPAPKKPKPGEGTTPKEEDCIPHMADPAVFYNRIAYGVGFSPRQRIEAMQAHANYLQFKGDTAGADQQYAYAIAVARSTPNQLDIDAVESSDTSDMISNPSNVTSNLLTAHTKHATQLARTNRTSSALPIYLACLQAVHTALAAPSSARTPAPTPSMSRGSFFREDVYPLPPTNGAETLSTLPVPILRAHEAELKLYIGEIIYASSPAQRETGLSWTRGATESVANVLRAAMAKQSQLKNVKSEAERRGILGLGSEDIDRAHQTLRVGINNWALMTEKLAGDARKKEEGRRNGWTVVRWVKGAGAEELEVAERRQEELERCKLELVADRLLSEYEFQPQ